ncbi:major facilitator superfamily transporter [Truncatella angustata]|uniref:Major facilitator superfamily transporter n=1 Tax=Truncatella angustata TaxID=152316 RepID=A0A9P8UCC3_9PEZI|nr:major facilitator superfamily transporter [Truncatella angustata]KAH6646025.1 major facilitator superfamily transporter [Truncatella angustata]
MSSLEPADPDVVASVKLPTGHEVRKSFHSTRKSLDPEPHVDELEKTAGTNYNNVDKELAQYAGQGTVEISESENRRLRRMIDRRVLVIMITVYFLQAIDKGTMTFASIMGIQNDAGLVGQEYSWLTSCIYITILIVEYPQNWIIARVPVAKYLSFSVIAWGAVLASHAACKSFTGLVTVRTLLGLFESACQPAFVVLSSVWYKREEQASRVTYWYMMNGAQQIVGGLLAYLFTLISSGPLKNWQWLFLTYGIISVLFGVFVGWWMPDSPMRAKCFSEEDKRLMVERVRSNQTGIQNREFKKYQVYEALTDPQTWCYAAIQLFTTLPTSGLGSFTGIIITGFGFSILQTQLLSMVLGAYIIAILLGSVWLVKKWNQNIWTMLGFVIPSFIGTALLMALPSETTAQHVGLLISYYITLSFWSAQTLGLSMLSRNVAGQTKKSVVVATNFIFWSVGNTIGPQVFLKWNQPRYFIAFAVHIGCYTALVLTLLFFRWHLARENKKKDSLGQIADEHNLTHAFEDLTDRENPNFRYIL